MKQRFERVYYFQKQLGYWNRQKVFFIHGAIKNISLISESESVSLFSFLSFKRGFCNLLYLFYTLEGIKVSESIFKIIEGTDTLYIIWIKAGNDSPERFAF